MSTTRFKFSSATPLYYLNKGKLLEDYDYANSTDYQSIFSSIKKNFKIHKVFRVNNPQLFGMYELYKEELGCDAFNQGKVKEYMLYHATSIENANNIAYNNIDWRRTTRSRYGKGACFARTPGYADEHSSSHEAFVICRVLVKNAERVDVNYELDVPSRVRYDTTLGNEDRVYVKFDDYNFYPELIVYYSCNRYNRRHYYYY